MFESTWFLLRMAAEVSSQDDSMARMMGELITALLLSTFAE
jgi:hypothetical protein